MTNFIWSQHTVLEASIYSYTVLEASIYSYTVLEASNT